MQTKPERIPDFLLIMRNFRKPEELRRQSESWKDEMAQYGDSIDYSAKMIRVNQKAIIRTLEAILAAIKGMGDRLSTLEQNAAESPVEAEIEPEKKETKKKK